MQNPKYFSELSLFVFLEFSLFYQLSLKFLSTLLSSLSIEHRNLKFRSISSPLLSHLSSLRLLRIFSLRLISSHKLISTMSSFSNSSASPSNEVVGQRTRCYCGGYIVMRTSWQLGSFRRRFRTCLEYQGCPIRDLRICDGNFWC